MLTSNCCKRSNSKRPLPIEPALTQFWCTFSGRIFWACAEPRPRLFLSECCKMCRPRSKSRCSLWRSWCSIFQVDGLSQHLMDDRNKIFPLPVINSLYYLFLFKKIQNKYYLSFYFFKYCLIKLKKNYVL